MSFVSSTSDPVVCRCFGVTESEIHAAADFAGCETVHDVKSSTEAGTGCTACHRRIIDVLRNSCAKRNPAAVNSALSK